MITLIIALTVGFGGFFAAHYAADVSMVWSVVLGVVGFGAFQAVAGIKIQKKVKADMDAVQRILLEGQKRIRQKMQRWQMRPPGSVQAAQREIAEDTKGFVKEALRQTDTLAKYRWFVPMMDKQIATAKLQLGWMIKDFKLVDELMPKALFLDPTMTAIKMARMYMLDADMAEIAKVYRKGVRRLRYNQNVLLAAAWSWMQIRKGDADGASKTLTEALKSSDDQTLRQNREHLMNNRVSHFSNSGIGDQWYSLLLEEPKVKMQRQRPVYR